MQDKICYMNFQKFPFVALIFLVLVGVVSCKDGAKKETNQQVILDVKEEAPEISVVKDKPENVIAPEGMVWISGKVYEQGAVVEDTIAMQHEKPAHTVAVDGFFMDITEVTNAQFAKFVAATNYITKAERALDWEELKKQVPPGTPKPHDSILQPGSLIFKKTKERVQNFYDYSQWWVWKIGANWQHPYGPKSSIKGKENHPVVHVTYEDAMAYCKWANRQLPTEAQWELASRGSLERKSYNWGGTDTGLHEKANTWDGRFPDSNSGVDGFEGSAPVRSYPANSYGLFDMAGNVWELTRDWYHVEYYQQLKDQGIVKNPQGPDLAFNPNNTRVQEKVLRGGSFLCHKSYCASYRNSARMANTLDSSAEHIGFRTIVTLEMLKQ